MVESALTASQRRDRAYGTRVTFSPKVFIPLTQLCRDGCQYCTFAQPPKRLAAPFLDEAQVLEIATAGARAGCHEALFTLGEAPEERWPVAREWLAERGYAMLLVDHDMGLVFETCHRVVVLNFGEVIASGAPESVRSDERVIAAYLGAGHQGVGA